MLLRSTICCAAVLSGTSAFAGGFAKPEPYVAAPAPVTAPAPVADYFSGLSLYGGLAAGSNNYDIDGDGTIGDTDFAFSLPDLGGEGLGATVGVGYDVRFGANGVVGGFFDYTASRITNDTELSIDDPLDIDAEIEFRQSSQMTLGARAGFTPSQQTLVYGLVGYSRGSFDGDLSGDATALADDYSLDLDGVTVGAGIETMLTDALSLRMEYRYTKFEDEELIDLGDLGADGSVDLETSAHRAHLMLNYRF